MWLTLMKVTYTAANMTCVAARTVPSACVPPLPHILTIVQDMAWKLFGEILLFYPNAVSFQYKIFWFNLSISLPKIYSKLK